MKTVFVAALAQMLGLCWCGIFNFMPPVIAGDKQRFLPVNYEIAQAGYDQEIREVTTVGRGETYDKAAQNAAKNALTQVVGAFLDSETIINKKTLINDGLVDRTKQITVDISEYSQGSIRSLEIITTSVENELYVVVAKVLCS